MPRCLPGRKTSLIIIILIIFSVCLFPHVFADSATDALKKVEQKYESISKKLQSTRDKISDTQKKISDLSSQLNVTQAQLNEIQSNIDDIRGELDVINQNLIDRKTKLGDKVALRNLVLRDYAKRAFLSELELFFAAAAGEVSGFQASTMSQALSKFISSDSLKIMDILNLEITSFEKDKKDAESAKTELESAQQNLISLKNNLAGEKKEHESNVGELQEQEESLQKELDSLQKQILSLKSSIDGGTVGDYEQPDAKLPDPPFSPAFAAFSYGAYSHYNGMSQYGAKGRADAGQKYQDILNFYYKSGVTKQSGFPTKISVQGYGELDFQYYLYGLAEMPTTWNIEALKAQAIAGRTYAYKHGKPICTTQSCQVFSKSKADKVKSGEYGNWKKAVDDTKDMILSGGSTSQYSSTTGGYINNVGWDIKGKWPNDAYEKKAGSPWFYKSWYTKSYADGNTCGHNHPWLSEREMADILNAWVLWKKGDKGHISPTTTSCWGGKPYSLDEMAARADKYGEKYTNVNNVDVDISNSGYTSTVHFQTNRGTVSINGTDFKEVFNLRAPGFVAIRSRLYDFEMRK